MRMQPPKLKLQAYGASVGTKCIELEIGPEVTEVIDDLEATKQLQMVKDTLSEVEYEELLLGQLHLVFVGEFGYDAAAEDTRQGITDFITELSQESLDLQVKLKRDPRQLRPPFMVLHTLGLVFTGTSQFYENFNYVVCTPALSTSVRGKDKPAAERFYPFALNEISQHKFSTFVFKVKAIEDWKEINTEFLQTMYIGVQKARIFVVADDASPEDTVKNIFEWSVAAYNIALANGVRAGFRLDQIGVLYINGQ